MTDKTLADLLALPAGRELDGYIAELCGREVDWHHNEPLEVINWDDGEVSYAPIPEISDDIAAAWPLLAEMLAAGVSVSMFYDEQNGLSMLWGDDDGGIGKDENVPSLTDTPLAIVRAWLVWKLAGAT